MIATVAGVVTALPPTGAVLRVGGVGLSVQTTPGTRARLRLGEPAELATSLVVREDSLTLYGFADDDERDLFELLQTSSGVGPRLAQAVLTVHTPDAVRRALVGEDLVALCLVPGIGRKGAQRMVLELKDRVGVLTLAASAAAGPAWRETLTQALLGLGFTGSAVDDEVARLVAARPEAGETEVPALLREALAALGGGPVTNAQPTGTGPVDAPPTGLRPTADRPFDGLTRPEAGNEDRQVEAALRPRLLSEFVGQERVREQLSLVLDSARRRGRPPDHVLLSGAPGLGKTSLAMIIAAELGTGIRVTSGPAMERAGDLASLITSLVPGEVLFIDEIHRTARPAEELLYMAMEDFRVDVVVGKGPGSTAIPLDVAPFTLVGATTRSGLLTGPLRDRFGFTAHMEPYTAAELQRVLERAAGLLGVDLRPDGADEIAGRSRGTPRVANRLLRRVRDFAEVRHDGVVTREIARAALAVYDVDELGLDRLDRAVLDALVRRFGGGPVGLSTLAVAVSEEPETVEEVAEPFLVRSGLVLRTPRGRVATRAAWRHLGLSAPGPVGALPLELD